MEEHLVDFSRAQFALTAIYHWLFVPLTLGLSFIVAILNTIYVKTGNILWKKTTKFWMNLFAINFAIGVATGIIMEFEFGTNWANYSWFVGDIFGAPLAIEGILAFFLESTFFAVMFFGWDKVGKKFHLLSTWLVAIGSNLSAFWILVANAWMQNPVGTTFNAQMSRNEMDNFFDVALSPTAVAKFLHTVGSGYVVASLFVVGISAYYLLKKREIIFAKKSMIVGSTFGIVASLFVALTGDESAHQVSLHQPMKLAAMEGLYEGERSAGIVAIGVLNNEKSVENNLDTFYFKFEIPYILSYLGYRDINAFVPGIKDIVYGNEKENIESASSKIFKGQMAIQSLKDYKQAMKANDEEKAKISLENLQSNMNYFGYGYLKDPKDIIPPVSITFYSFHLMVALGVWFIVLFGVILYLLKKQDISTKRLWLWLALLSTPLGLIASELGWIVAEVGRQPWAIQDLMPVNIAATHLSSVNVQISFWLFALLFTTLLIAEIKIMLKQILIGPHIRDKGINNV